MRLAIYGTGGLGKELLDIATRRNSLFSEWTDIWFINDFREEGEVHGAKCVHFETLLKHKADFSCVVGVGEPSDREKLFDKLLEKHVAVAGLVDPSAIVSPSAKVGEGSIICEYTVLHADAVVGRNCLIQPFAGVAHDVHLGDHSVLSSFCVVGGCSVFGSRVFAGMHSSIKEKLTIGDDVIIAMGAAVFQSLPSGVTVVGNPARITKGREDHKVFSAA
jgi:sugar O-acyltransferase (sialic acid O-acetyltransferase NeuD family)